MLGLLEILIAQLLVQQRLRDQAREKERNPEVENEFASLQHRLSAGTEKLEIIENRKANPRTRVKRKDEEM